MNMGLLSVPNLVPGLMFIINILGNITDQFCKISLLCYVMLCYHVDHPPDLQLWVLTVGDI